ncbi:MAG: hypothetical protein EOO93_04315 [Pedobacter sp.]|nr:MAG: hypothetical protein EOO93_04315 [Pedobacter sp.]
MTEQIRNIIDRLKTYIKKAEESGDKYDFIDPAYEVADELNGIENNFDAIEPILLIIERSPDIDYGGPGPLGSFLENHYKKGYEELLLKSIERRPTEFTLHLLHRLINDKNNPNFQTYFDLMKKISLSNEYPENIIENAKDSLTYFE